MTKRTGRTSARAACVAIALTTLAACGPHVTLPPRPAHIDRPFASRTVGTDTITDSADVALAIRLAPVLYIQRDEAFSLRRVVAVLHPTRRVIAYHLLWNHDVNGQWVPWAKASDAEELWVGYDSTGASSDLWTYWHGAILHADWHHRGQPSAYVQWGKHGTLPYGVIESDLPPPRTLNVFYAMEFLLLPEIWLGKASHGGTWGFFHSYKRYREFTRIMPLDGRIDAVVRSDDPHPVLEALFGAHFADKRHWP